MHLTPEIEKQLEAAAIEWCRKYAPHYTKDSVPVAMIIGARIGYEMATNQPAAPAAKGE